MKSIPCFFLLFAILFKGVDGKLSCLDNDGNEVDYWYGYTGYKSWDFYYLGPDDTSFKKTSYEMTQSTEGAIFQTLNQLWNYGGDQGNLGYGFYNDEPPGCGDDSDAMKLIKEGYGHSKGVLGFDNDQGFWLVHSKPLWPANIPSDGSSDAGIYPKPGADPCNKKKKSSSSSNRNLMGYVYGQSFLCITFPKSTFESIASLHQLARAKFYGSQIPTNFQVPNFEELLKGPVAKTKQLAQSIVSAGGKSFTQFTKSVACNCDLYDQIVAPSLKTDLEVSTWDKGGSWKKGSKKNNLGSNCKRTSGHAYSVLQIDGIQMPDGTTWNDHDDHAKWAISAQNSDSHFVCVGDINRQCTQELRGGGTVCTDDKTVWSAYYDIVSSTYACPKTTVTCGTEGDVSPDDISYDDSSDADDSDDNDSTDGTSDDDSSSDDTSSARTRSRTRSPKDEV